MGSSPSTNRGTRRKMCSGVSEVCRSHAHASEWPSSAPTQPVTSANATCLSGVGMHSGWNRSGVPAIHRLQRGVRPSVCSRVCIFALLEERTCAPVMTTTPTRWALCCECASCLAPCTAVVTNVGTRRRTTWRGIVMRHWAGQRSAPSDGRGKTSVYSSTMTPSQRSRLPLGNLKVSAARARSWHRAPGSKLKLLRVHAVLLLLHAPYRGQISSCWSSSATPPLPRCRTNSDLQPRKRQSPSPWTTTCSKGTRKFSG